MKNASFEADRKLIPSHVKPVQTQLTGWNSIVIKGNAISLDSTSSPILNHNNTQTERKIVIGEKSLNISDKIEFKRKVYQEITSSPYVNLNDGYYTLTAKVKNSSGFDKLEMYAVSNGKKYRHAIKEENASWKRIEIKRVKVKGGKVEIGFLAEGEANAFCYVDNVELVNMR